MGCDTGDLGRTRDKGIFVLGACIERAAARWVWPPKTDCVSQKGGLLCVSL